jgi:hypothetical protein
LIAVATGSLDNVFKLTLEALAEAAMRVEKDRRDAERKRAVN